jgi:polyhydroxyalkanoate synthase subunit PhaC
MSDQHKRIAAHANLPDPAAAQRALASIFVNAVKATRAAHQALAQPEPLAFDPADQVRPLLSFGFALFSQPVLLGEAQLRAWNEWLALWNSTLQRTAGGAADPVIAPARGDRRFSDPAWTEELWFDHLKQAYLLVGRQLSRLVDSVGGIEDDTRLRVGFMVRQYLDALAPTNFAATNPEVIRKAMETGGVNLLAGLANMLADAAGNHGLVKRRSAEGWELGVSIAATPGSVVFQNELLQLIQYNPATEQVARRPLLYVPPLVNKYYLLDLQPKSSLLKWLVDQGRTVFAISWVNPGPELRDKDLSSYVIGGVVAAMDAVRDATGEPDVDLAAFCMGGTLSASAAAYLAARGQGDRVGSMTLIGTLLDFSDLREWSVFMGEGDLQAAARKIEPRGYVEGHDLQKLFSLMRANDLIWSSVVSHYLLDKEAPPSDILWWFDDGARIPAGFVNTFGEQMIKGNRLREPGGVVIDGTALDLGQIKAPVLLISLRDDHVSAWEGTYLGAHLFGGHVRFLLGGSGHNAGVINPPTANKHGYWTAAALPGSAEAWIAGAEKRPGSWWPEWQAWLTGQDGAETPSRLIGAGKLEALEPAPGSYVRVR